MTEIEERRRRQTIRTLITEIFMFAVIVVLVVVLALVAMGYQLNFEKGVEHSGLVQINSIPTGAAITVDGDGVFLPTNQSRTMVSGEHTITLERDGYTSWEKTISVTEGMLYRLTYPRLYREDREKTPIELTFKNTTSDTTIEPTSIVLKPARAFVSPDRKALLLNFSNSTIWQYFNLNDSEPRIQSVDPTGFIAGDLEIRAWLNNNTELLVKQQRDNVPEWILFNLAKPAESINLTKAFALDFTDIRAEGNDKLLALNGAGLREINLSSKEISKVLIPQVDSFTNLASVIAYASAGKIYLFNVGDSEPSLVTEIEGSAENQATPPRPLLVLGEYFGDYYLAYTLNQKFHILTGRDFTHKMKLKATSDLSFTPNSLKIRGDGELIVASNAADQAVFDAENYRITSFTAESAPRWLSEYDFYTMKDGWLTAHDFDNTNPHALVENLHATLPALISENDRYLYYFTADSQLIRENIR